MFKIVRTLPVKTRLPFAAWVLAGLVTLFSLVTSMTEVSSPMVQAAKPAMAHYASMTDLLNLFGAL
jgi:ABC-type polysaccharide/polyol phosphate export permease